MNFDSSKVTRKSFKGGFPEADYNLELADVHHNVASTGTYQVSIQWRIRGERYDNLTVFEQFSMTDKAFEVAINKILDAGLPVPEIKTTSKSPEAAARQAANQLEEFLKGHIGHMANARVYEAVRDGGTTPERVIRHYN